MAETIEYMLLSLVLLSLFMIVLSTMTTTASNTYNVHSVESILNRVRTIMNYLPFEPDGSTFIIANPNQLPIRIYQGRDSNGIYFVQFGVTSGDIVRTVNIYNLRIDNLPVGGSRLVTDPYITLMKVSTEQNGEYTLVHVVLR